MLDKIKSFEGEETQFGFNAGASESEIAELKSTFKLSELPSALEEILKASNGVDQLMDSIKIGDLIWPVDRNYRNKPTIQKLSRLQRIIHEL